MLNQDYIQSFYSTLRELMLTNMSKIYHMIFMNIHVYLPILQQASYVIFTLLVRP